MFSGYRIIRDSYEFPHSRKISEASPGGTVGLSACPGAPPTSALPYTSSTRYDADGRVTGTIAPDPDGAGPLPSPAVRNGYDAAGRLIRVEEGSLAAWQNDSVAPASWSGFVPHRIVDTQYDALDRKIRTVFHWAGITEYSYDLHGRLRCTAVRMNPDVWGTPLPDKCVPGPVHAVNGPDRISKNVYDAAGQLIEVWDGVGTPLQRREALYTYNGNGQRTSLTDARGFRAEMRFDGFGRQSRWIFPSKTATGTVDESDYEEYLYDPNGNRTSLRKRDGSVLTFHYDALNRTTAKIVPERSGLAAAHTRDVHYAYDLRGLQTEARFDGLTGEGVSNAWDGFGRNVSTTNNMGGISRTVSHKYDSEGRRIELAFPDSVKAWFARDRLGRMTDGYQGALGDSSHIMIAFAYDAAARRSRFARKYGDWTSYGYDAAGRLSALSSAFPGATGNVAAAFGYNPASQLVRETRDNDAYAWTGSVAVSRDYGINGQNQYAGTVSNGAPSACWSGDHGRYHRSAGGTDAPVTRFRPLPPSSPLRCWFPAALWLRCGRVDQP